MRESTIGAGFARGLMELAVSKGASCAVLAAVSYTHLDVYKRQEMENPGDLARSEGPVVGA